MTSGTERTTDADADAVWAVLADGWQYAMWVVGASRIRAVDSTWPSPGSSIHHSVGLWPAVLDDTTTVPESFPGRELQLRARALPFGTGHITVRLHPQARGCRIQMIEDAASKPFSLLPDSLQHGAVHPRNSEALRRLALLAERATH
ncbi:SRPBCC family protein [Rhodococcus sp. H36-A4]|uniref:SRPBCC family protein n=1 Tax=Rhodococcus sp. H36-A4 TaxID=3004353 RepID=UPI0022AF55EC|nr:SRPBCC family protein [Rhodococcus sp. H36-A4]MCZ4079929.1 SRPBCC family protein [Rhodococcus sp. H36-A4]